MQSERLAKRCPVLVLGAVSGGLGEGRRHLERVLERKTWPVDIHCWL